MLPFLSELRRRNVLRVGAAYTVVAWLIVQVAATIFPVFGFGEPAVRIVVILLAIGLVPVMVLSWAFELTPEGVKRERAIDRSRPIAPRSGKKLDRLIMVMLALALGYFAFDKFVLSVPREAAIAESARQAGRSQALVESYGEKSIAVLPFLDMSSTKDQEYLSDGIAEELMNLLAQVPELRVISRSSAFSYKGKDIKLAQVAEELNVAHVLEGSVRKADNRVRITAQLIDAHSDTHLWSQTYERTLDDIFAIQDEIAAAVVAELEIRLLGDAPRVAETDPEAYAMFLQARHLSRLGTAEGYDQSIALFQQALAIDSNYPAAWNGLATDYISQTDRGLRSFDEGYALAREAAEKALAMQPDFAPAHAGLGWIAMMWDGDLAAAARHFEKAFTLAPGNVDILSDTAVLLQNLGRVQQAITLQQIVTAHDPLNPNSHVNLGLSYFWAGRWDEAIASVRTALRLSPSRIGAPSFLGTALLMKGEPEAALMAVQEETFEVYRLIGLTMVYQALGRETESDAALSELIGKHEREWAYNIAYVLAYRGEADRAFAWLDKAVEYGDPGLSQIAGESLFANLHRDPRWLPFLHKLGKGPEQLAKIPLQITLPRQVAGPLRTDNTRSGAARE